MVRPVFVDTAYLVALLDPRDTMNARALALAEQLGSQGAPLVTTDAIVLEFANYFARSPLRSRVPEWTEAIRANGGWEVLPIERFQLLRAEARYRAHVDKNWSLTDCLSMEIMSARRLKEIATTDQGFAQAGFRLLLR